MMFEDWLEQEYGEDACWDEGWNKGDMQRAFEAGASNPEPIRIVKWLYDDDGKITGYTTLEAPVEWELKKEPGFEKDIKELGERARDDE